MLSLFKKPTFEEKIEKRVQDVFVQLTSTIESEFTPLETVSILNQVKVKTSEWLKDKHAEYLEKSVMYSNMADEVQSAIENIK